REIARGADPRRGAAVLAGVAAEDAVRADGAALDGLLAVQRRPAAPGEPHPPRRRQGGPRADREQHGSAPSLEEEAGTDARQDRRTPAAARAQPVPGQE